MIKTGIVGAESPIAGELIRILVNHPEVELISVCASGLAGRKVSDHHAGLIGETNLRFVDHLETRPYDILFLCGDISGMSIPSDLKENIKVILCDNCAASSLPSSLGDIELVDGLSELYRKPLVRGAHGAGILNPLVAMSLISLFPLALHLMLPEDLTISSSLPEWCNSESLLENSINDINKRLSEVQLSFKGVKDIAVNFHKSREVSVEIELKSSVSIEEILKIYDSIYDDHNFTFIVGRKYDPSEVIGTQKCLLYIHKPSEDTLRIEGVADALYRGGVGDAVHSMNLLFGLFEKIGLVFKAPLAFKGI